MHHMFVHMGGKLNVERGRRLDCAVNGMVKWYDFCMCSLGGGVRSCICHFRLIGVF